MNTLLVANRGEIYTTLRLFEIGPAEHAARLACGICCGMTEGSDCEATNKTPRFAGLYADLTASGSACRMSA